ncbi:hypothetical protein [Mobiluncus mulieris]|uniref:hypothetical protein n=1 Tax=Mobiluncus mulieris TaxID=2052 RepID=UPI00209401DD|nr:hypothetical protein [Mobiluncus mulieris]
MKPKNRNATNGTVPGALHPEPATFKIDDQDRLTVIFPETATIRGVAPGQSL